MRRYQALATTGAALTLLLAATGCSGTKSATAGTMMTAAGSASYPASSDVAPAAAATTAAAATADAAGGSLDSSRSNHSVAGTGSADTSPKPATYGDVAGPDRQIISIATMTVELKADATVASAVHDAIQVVEKLGGRVDAQKIENRTDGGHDALLVLKVPPAGFAQAIDALSALGIQRSLDQSTQDVTAQVVDLESRATTADSSIKRIRDLMSRATSIRDVVALEGELTQREATKESQLAQAKALRGQSAMGTITLSFVEKGVVPPPPVKIVHHHGFVAGLKGGWHAFSATVVALLTATGAAAPFAVPVMVILAVAVAIRRRRRSTTPIAPVEPATT